MVVLHGKERFLQDQYLLQLREALTKAHGADGFDIVRFDGLAMGGRSVADVLDECRSFGLMVRFKVVIVDNAEALLKGDDEEGAAAPPAPARGAKSGAKRPKLSLTNREVFESYIEAPSDTAVLVIRAGVWRPGKIDKKIGDLGPPAGVIIKCEEQSFDELVRWAVKRCEKRHRSTIDADTAGMLVELIGSDLGRLDQELEKLAVGAGGAGQPITRDHVLELVGRTRQEAFWQIQSALLTGDPTSAIGKLRELVQVSRHDPVPLTWTYVELARKLYAVSEGQRPQMWGESAQQIPRVAREAGPVKLAALLCEALETDAAGKSGVGEPVRNLERLTLRFTSLASTRR